MCSQTSWPSIGRRTVSVRWCEEEEREAVGSKFKKSKRHESRRKKESEGVKNGSKKEINTLKIIYILIYIYIYIKLYI